jgi:hypothetical protein
MILESFVHAKKASRLLNGLFNPGVLTSHFRETLFPQTLEIIFEITIHWGHILPGTLLKIQSK